MRPDYRVSMLKPGTALYSRILHNLARRGACQRMEMNNYDVVLSGRLLEERTVASKVVEPVSPRLSLCHNDSPKAVCFGPGDVGLEESRDVERAS